MYGSDIHFDITYICILIWCWQAFWYNIDILLSFLILYIWKWHAFGCHILILYYRSGPGSSTIVLASTQEVTCILILYLISYYRSAVLASTPSLSRLQIVLKGTLVGESFCIYTYIYLYIYTFTYIYIYIHIYVYIYIYKSLSGAPKKQPFQNQLTARHCNTLQHTATHCSTTTAQWRTHKLAF